MNLRIRLFFLLISILTVMAARTQELPAGGYRAIHWGQEEGLLKERWHNSIIKDKKGWIWFCSAHGEISRFDGSQFHQLTPKFNNKYSQKAAVVISIVEDSLNNIWLGTQDGLIRYDIRADSFNLVSRNVNKSGGIIGLYPFWATDSVILCFQQNEVMAVNIYDHTIKKLADLSSIPELQPEGICRGYSVFDSNTNTLWLLFSQGEGLVKFNLATGKSTVHRRDEYALFPKSGYHQNAEAMCFDRKRNSLWINSHDGLYQFTLKDEKFHRVEALTPLVVSGKYNRWVGIDIDKTGRVWFASEPEGILIYQPDFGTLSRAFVDSTEKSAIANSNLKIYCDRDEMVWLAYWGNNEIYQILPFNPTVTRYFAKPMLKDSMSASYIFHMIPADDGKLWIGTTNGLNIFDPSKNTFEVLHAKDFHGIEGEAISPAFLKLSEGKAWLNANPGDQIFEVDLATRNCQAIQFKDEQGNSLKSGNVAQFLTRSYKKGFLFYDAGHGIFDYQRKDLSAKLVIPINGGIFRMQVVEDSLLFLLAPGRGDGQATFANRNDNWIEIDHPANHIGWSDVVFDQSDKTFWAAVGNAIVHYSFDFKVLREFVNKGAHPATLIYSLIIDRKKNIWYSDNRRDITFLNTSAAVFYTLTQQDGFEKQTFDYFSPAGVVNGDEVFFAGSDISRIPASLARIRSGEFGYPPSLPYIRALEINQRPFAFTDNLTGTNEFHLKYFQNKISIETGIIDFYSRGKSSIRYKLNGEDSGWHYAPYYHTITYEELPHGKYEVLLQASNTANEFTGPSQKMIFIIHPAFWDTWWFRIPTGLVLLGIGYVLLRRSIRRKYRKRLERSEKERQIAELKQKSSELEMQALRAQMNPHFIFNSLNSINRFILQNNRLQASEFLTKFSRLIRLILQNSQAPYISMESELESLRLYLELEALRFDYRFAYKISVDDNADVSLLQVPPLMIQPYVENAIWHGLMHKEGRGELDIEVSQEEKYVYIRIADNGIGRKQAAAMSSKSATKHKSMGLRITEHRISMMHTENGLESPVYFHDLEHADGTAAGTEVIIKIPVMYD